MYAFTCAAVAPEGGLRPGIVSTPVVFSVVMRIKLPACHEPLILLPVTSVHQLAVDPPLLPAETTMARRKGVKPVTGSARVLLVMWPIAVPAGLGRLLRN